MGQIDKRILNKTCVKENFTPAFFTLETNPCKPNPCQEDVSECIPIDAASFSCKCMTGYEKNDNGKCKGNRNLTNIINIRMHTNYCLLKCTHFLGKSSIRISCLVLKVRLRNTLLIFL